MTGASIYNGHLRGPSDTHTYCREFRSGAVTTFFCCGWDSNTQPSASKANALTHCATAMVFSNMKVLVKSEYCWNSTWTLNPQNASSDFWFYKLCSIYISFADILLIGLGNEFMKWFGNLSTFEPVELMTLYSVGFSRGMRRLVRWWIHWLQSTFLRLAKLGTKHHLVRGLSLFKWRVPPFSKGRNLRNSKNILTKF